MLILILATAPLLACIAVDDVAHHRIRNRHLAALATVTAAGLSYVAASAGADILVRAAVGAALAATPLVAAAWTQPSRMGGGDIKLAGLVGALLGAVDPWLSLAAVGAALGGTLVVLGLRRAADGPLAPGLAAGAVVALALHVTLT